VQNIPHVVDAENGIDVAVHFSMPVAVLEPLPVPVPEDEDEDEDAEDPVENAMTSHPVTARIVTKAPTDAMAFFSMRTIRSSLRRR
jgi:hypothetical protein